jgi:hypothetical protein
MFAIALVYRRMAQGESRRMQMRRTILTSIVLLVLMFVLVGGLPAVAQSNDPLATNTPSEVIAPVVATLNGEPVEATLVAPGDAQPPVVVVEQPASDKTIYVIGFLILTVFVGLREFMSNKQLGTLVATVNKALDNKQVLDEATRTYMQSSLQVQEFIKLVTGVAGFAGSMIPGKDLADDLHDFGEKVIAGEQPPTNTTSVNPPGTYRFERLPEDDNSGLG